MATSTATVAISTDWMSPSSKENGPLARAVLHGAMDSVDQLTPTALQAEATALVE
jgi:hypothetical protein